MAQSIAATIDPHKFLKIRLYSDGINPESASIQDWRLREEFAVSAQVINTQTIEPPTAIRHSADYLIVGSGLSALVFGALMAKAGKRVEILEAHEYPGGFGHTFTMAHEYHFNAQLHYVWNCGEGNTVNLVLKRLGLDRAVTFERYDPNGFDHMRMPG